MPKCDFNKVASNFIKITLWHGCSPVYLMHIFRILFPKKTSGGLFLENVVSFCSTNIPVANGVGCIIVKKSIVLAMKVSMSNQKTISKKMNLKAFITLVSTGNA